MQEECKVFCGEIIFSISDDKPIEVDFDTEMVPTKIVNEGDWVASGKKAPKYKWIYKIKYNGEKEYYNHLEMMLNKLYKKRKYINQLTNKFEEVSCCIYIRSDFAEIDYSIPNHILKKIALLDCSFDFSILSFGMAYDA